MNKEIEWISVKDKLPYSLMRVLIAGKNESGSSVIEIATYIHKKTVLEEDFIADDYLGGDTGCSYYDDETDKYWVVEGWWYASTIDELNILINEKDFKVTHWANLPFL